MGNPDGPSGCRTFDGPARRATLAAMRLEASHMILNSLEIVVTLPIVVALAVVLAISGARQRVVEWLASLPFAVDNMNLILNGLEKPSRSRSATSDQPPRS